MHSHPWTFNTPAHTYRTSLQNISSALKLKSFASIALMEAALSEFAQTHDFFKNVPKGQQGQQGQKVPKQNKQGLTGGQDDQIKQIEQEEQEEQSEEEFKHHEQESESESVNESESEIKGQASRESRDKDHNDDHNELEQTKTKQKEATQQGQTTLLKTLSWSKTAHEWEQAPPKTEAEHAAICIDVWMAAQASLKESRAFLYSSQNTPRNTNSLLSLVSLVTNKHIRIGTREQLRALLLRHAETDEEKLFVNYA